MYNEVLARYVTRLLMMMGFSPRHFGFGYIREMILISFESKDKQLSHLYPLVSQRNNLPIEAVQTAVRTALKTAQDQKSFCQIEHLMGTKFLENNYFTPREFVAIMVEYLTYVWDGQCETILPYT